MAAYRGVFRTWSNIYKEAFFAKIPNGLKLLTIFEKNFRRRCSTRLKTVAWLRVWNIFLCICGICKNTFLAEHHQTTASNYSSINSSEGTMANETVNYDAETKAYVTIWDRSVKLSKKGNPGEIRTVFRSSRSQMSFKIGVINDFANSTGKHLCWRQFLIKLQSWRLY